ncbi:MAG: hypothetical protein GY803_32725 [Chloroflexi bacterium]|nr:hypothetical protein [Chloroflexota bacterium]
MNVRIIDAFPAFLDFWREAADEAIETQIEAWATDYMAAWPELLTKQQADYVGMGEDWRQIAREKVFPGLAARLPAMREAYERLRPLIQPIFTQAQEKLEVELDVVIVIYVGIGCGAGWVTTYAGQPAILFGLENIAEEGWLDEEALVGLLAHEIGHVVHFHWLDENGRVPGEDPWHQLYNEGVAQHIEHLVLGRDTWHMIGRSLDWLDWCEANLGWLAAEFLRVVDGGREAVRPFFGSWFDVRGYKQTGYFLGCQLIRRLAARMTLREIALLPDVEATLRRELENLTGIGCANGSSILLN